VAWANRVIWSEGLFLKPHHFQQQDRYVEYLVASSCQTGAPFSWGMRRLGFDRDLLALGKLGVTEAVGLLPDNTPVHAPANDPLPAPIVPGGEAAGQIVYLALPLRRPNARESGGPDDPQSMLRYRAGEETARDNAGDAQTEEVLEVGRLDLRLLMERENRDGFACCGVARILESRADGQLLLDPDYIPPSVDIAASDRLLGFVEELLGLCGRRADALAARVRAGAGGGVSELANFLLLQLINRSEPSITHLVEMRGGHHPETLYRDLLQLRRANCRPSPPTISARQGFRPIGTTISTQPSAPCIEALRQSLSREGVERAIPIPIQERKFGFRVALVADKSLFARRRAIRARRQGERRCGKAAWSISRPGKARAGRQDSGARQTGPARRWFARDARSADGIALPCGI
jgi:type VI secretion system protein ImpJ